MKIISFLIKTSGCKEISITSNNTDQVGMKRLQSREVEH